MRIDYPIEIFQADDGRVRLEVQLKDETVWLTQAQMVSFFNRDKSLISRHIKNMLKEGELLPDAVVAKNATTADDGKVYQVDYYNLDVIISLCCRVKSKRGMQFRQISCCG